VVFGLPAVHRHEPFAGENVLHVDIVKTQLLSADALGWRQLRTTPAFVLDSRGAPRIKRMCAR
jgi:hypothetical protein